MVFLRDLYAVFLRDLYAVFLRDLYAVFFVAIFIKSPLDSNSDLYLFSSNVSVSLWSNLPIGNYLKNLSNSGLNALSVHLVH